MSLTPEGRPSFLPQEVSAFLRQVYGLDGPLSPLPAEWDQNFHLEGDQGNTYVVKIANCGRGSALLDFENSAMDWLGRRWTTAQSPRLVRALSGDILNTIHGETGLHFRIRVLTYIPGQRLADCRPLDPTTLQRIGHALGELDCCMAGFEQPAMQRDMIWDLRNAEWISAHTSAIADLGRRGIVERLLLQYRARIKPLLPELPLSVIHNDANDENLLLEPAVGGGWQVAGLIDFGDMVKSHTVNELAIACAYAIFDEPDPLDVITQMTAGYYQARPLSELEIRALFPLILMRLCTSVTNSAIAAQKDPVNEHRQISDRPAWEMLEQLEPLDWRSVENRLRQACGLATRHHPAYESQQELLDLRAGRIGPSLSLAYRSPLVIVRGRGQFLFDEGGRAYLDCVNNVCHLGHCHPKVVAALSQQAAILNTNTRYLHPYLGEYAERLAATLPEPLRVCYFVNSGSEANELAVRLARACTGRQDVIVVDGAYHGNTSTLVDLSPYKAEGPGGLGLPGWAHKVPKPDPYRGPHRGYGEETGLAYAEYVRLACERLQAQGRPPALFICESIMGCGGQVALPDGYLRAAFEHVRAAGGVCILDEVQVGMGRAGTHMWAFEAQDVIPDILTVGKPIGNGHPLGAVITTPEIARAFDNGMEYFNTFGGNPVSMAVGLAVLEIIEEEGLREQAARVGEYLRAGFMKLGGRHPQIGDVRGLGLFIGVELVEDCDTLAPATALTAGLIEALKADGILLSAEGPYHNVLKIKPPLQFAEIDADLLLGAVDRALSQALSNDRP